jgi:hypothetical protein
LDFRPDLTVWYLKTTTNLTDLNLIQLIYVRFKETHRRHCQFLFLFYWNF